MKCVGCGYEETVVKDSRPIGETQRRRRICGHYNLYFTTKEYTEDQLDMFVSDRLEEVLDKMAEVYRYIRELLQGAGRL